VADLRARLRHHRVVGFDTSIFIYKLEASSRYVHLATDALDGLVRGEYRGVTSSLTLMDICVRPLQLGRLEVADEYETLLMAFPNLTITDLDRHIAR
jgi:hypothetical protein